MMILPPAIGPAAITIDHRSTTGPVRPKGMVVPTEEKAELKSTDKLITGVPAYLWYHGCGPTAVGMILGYHDTHGYPSLITGNAKSLTAEVKQFIASSGSSSNPGHYEDYVLPEEPIQQTYVSKDKSEWPYGDEHKNNCLADFMKTSESVYGNLYGETLSNDLGPGTQAYIASITPQYTLRTADYRWGQGLSWDIVKSEINAARPLILMVDSNGDGHVDHFVTCIGYRESNGYPEYACYDTWPPVDQIVWKRFRAVSNQYDFGVYKATTFKFDAPRAETVAWVISGR